MQNEPCNEPYEIHGHWLYCQKPKGHKSPVHAKGINAVEMRRRGYRRNEDGRFVKSGDPRA